MGESGQDFRAMGTVHQLIRDEGRQGALNFGVERQEVEAAVSLHG